ncbi:hypothetical protein [Clostridium gasigenes]|uniref:Uncharacterized protein n=1 Tax=Clostridium gasigenes TaxID=94869 RepID=A0A1H0TA96_9CLOT|nr:hypothetical protein [Clostridium gasigenes]SDP50630.1 hypothetical protein SAMN04488529_106143 [Clostridium gasigenes]
MRLIITAIGMVILIISLKKLFQIKKESIKLTDTEFYSNERIIERRKYLIFAMIGISIT